MACAELGELRAPRGIPRYEERGRRRLENVRDGFGLPGIVGAVHGQVDVAHTQALTGADLAAGGLGDPHCRMSLAEELGATQIARGVREIGITVPSWQ